MYDTINISSNIDKTLIVYILIHMVSMATKVFNTTSSMCMEEKLGTTVYNRKSEFRNIIFYICPEKSGIFRATVVVS